MSLSSTLTTALTGLTASARAADLVASNVANLQTDTYGHRSLSLSSAQYGGGVVINGVTRATDPVLTGDRRLAQAATGAEDIHLAFYKKMETAIGLPGSGNSLSDRISALSAALETASLAPSSPSGLTGILHAGQDLARGLNQLTSQTQLSRTLAEQSIARDVAQLNESLARVAAINRQIPRLTAMRQDISGLVDQRQALIDQIASIVPLREAAGQGGAVTLYTTGGVALLDGHAAEFSFIPSGTIAADSGTLSGLSVNGRQISTSEQGPLGGGSLAAAFHLRDITAPELQQKLDTVARDLILRFEAADPDTASSGVAALLSDGGQRFNPALQNGLASRIAVSPAADPDQGGALWRIWSGMAATVPKDVSDNRILTDLAGSLLRRTTTAGVSFSPGQRSATDLSGALFSLVSTERLSAAGRAGFASGQLTLLRHREAEIGVDSDNEVQALLRIETAYAANARVIQAVDDMLQQLLRI
ncbi:flagellar hook-associated protein FlgK [Falsigemmobacter faecalis]|uniref:Flagellar hook-associated protein 1 n=1 Tax=Falsigemmobacter faecalis TaxID=2488730 RepID=A0A3P3DUS2_9RHOB|nr:flagellar hook-associated protein FlgK [Falsigemmobacter faecalis]RRH78047.1 flagellar hook-associated protein FlgK [Falsigemmobacter faecalis]